MAKKGTTFRTSKGVVVSVTYPDVYIQPGYVLPEDVTSPAEMRGVLREELERRGLGRSPILRSLSLLKLTKYSGNPILNIGGVGAWDEGHIHFPVVLKDEPNWKMWYNGRTPAVWVDPVGWQIGYATSPDGINWTKYAGNPVFSPGGVGAWDATRIWAKSVIRDGNTYKMWYSGRDAAGVERIGYATSPNGVTWTKYAGNPVLTIGGVGTWDESGLSNPIVLKDGDGTYKMWYAGSNSAGIMSIGYATSPDGVTWTKYAGNPVMYQGASGTWNSHFVAVTCVNKIQDIYVMFYEGLSPTDGTWPYWAGMAISEDGIHWYEHPDNPILINGAAGAWDDVHATAIWCVKWRDEYRFYYEGYDGSNWRIGLATSVVTYPVAVDPSERIKTQTEVDNSDVSGPGEIHILHTVPSGMVFYMDCAYISGIAGVNVGTASLYIRNVADILVRTIFNIQLQINAARGLSLSWPTARAIPAGYDVILTAAGAGVTSTAYIHGWLEDGIPGG